MDSGDAANQIVHDGSYFSPTNPVPNVHGSFSIDSATLSWQNRGAGTSFATRHCINRAKLTKRATPAENVFLHYLESLGLSYRFQQGFYTPYYRIVDFYLPDHNLIIEVDGPCHNPEKDCRRDEWFTRVRGIPILRLTNEQVMSGDFEFPCTIGVR